MGVLQPKELRDTKTSQRGKHGKRKGKEVAIILNLKGCILASGTDTKEALWELTAPSQLLVPST